MMFNIGQKVVCVDDGGTVLVERGRIYTVHGIGASPKLGLAMLWLDEVLGADIELAGMYARRFRPIVERKTDISIFTKMLIDKREFVQ
jgi:hypothetical protein